MPQYLIINKNFVLSMILLIILNPAFFHTSYNIFDYINDVNTVADLKPGETYYIEISDSINTIDKYITIEIPGQGIYIIYVSITVDFEINYPLERDLSVFVKLELYDETNTLKGEKVLRAVNDEMIVSNFFDYVLSGTYKLRIYSDKLKDSIDSSYTRITGVGVIVGEASDLVVLKPGQGIGFPQYVTGSRRDIDFFVWEPVSDYSIWDKYEVLYGILNDLDIESSFYIDRFQYDRGDRDYTYIDQNYIRIPAHKIHILSTNYRPGSGRFYHYWKIFNNEVDIEKYSFIMVYPFKVNVNSSIDAVFSRIHPYNYIVNAYSTLFNIMMGREYVLYIDSSSPVDLKIYESSIIKKGTDISLIKSFEDIRRKVYVLRTNISSTNILPVILWNGGETIPETKIVVSQLNRMSSGDEIVLPITSNGYGWSYAFKSLDNMVALINTTDTDAYVAVQRRGGDIDTYLLSKNNALIINIDEGDIILIYNDKAVENASLNIKTFRRGIQIHGLQSTKYIDISKNPEFNISFNIVNNNVDEESLKINIEKPSFIRSKDLGEKELLLEPLENRNITLYFSSLEIGYGVVNISFINRGKTIYRYSITVDWNNSLISPYISKNNYTLYMNSQVISSLHIINKYDKPIEIYLNIRSLNPSTASIEALQTPLNKKITIKPGENNIDFIITAVKPGETYVEISIYKYYPQRSLKDLVFIDKIYVKVIENENLIMKNETSESSYEKTLSRAPEWAKGPLGEFWKFVDKYSDLIKIIGFLATVFSVLIKGILKILHRRSR